MHDLDNRSVIASVDIKKGEKVLFIPGDKIIIFNEVFEDEDNVQD